MQPTLVLLPGLPGTANLFDPLQSAMPSDLPRRVISYPGDRIRSIHELYKILESQLADLNEMVLLAESYSGPLALRFAANRPERARAIVLVASYIRLPKPNWFQRLIAPILFRLPPYSPAMRRYLAGPNPPREVIELLRDSIRQNQPEVLLQRLYDSFRIDASSDLTRCKMPLLYIRGQQDRIMPAEALAPILQIRPDTTVRLIPGPHMLTQVHPLESWREISQFLMRLG